MRKRFSWVGVLLVGMLLLAAAAPAMAGKLQNQLAQESTLEQVLRRGVLRVGFDTFVPWAMKNKKGEFIGMEIDVMKKLAADMGVKIELVPTRWAGIIPALLTGKFDVIIGGMAITPERSLKVNFTLEPYYYAGQELVANRKLVEPINPKKLEDFNRPDVIFAERMGITTVQFLKRVLPKAQIREFDDPSAAYQEVLAGRAHATITDAPEPGFWAAKYPDQLYMPLGHKKLTHEPIAFAVRKGDMDWLVYLTNWIKVQKARGFLQERYHYWFETRDWADQVE